MSDNENENGLVAGWWAASTDADHEQVTLYRKEGSTESLLDRFTVTRDTMPTLEDFQLEVKKNYGGGEYVAVMRGNQGQFARRIKFAVAGLPKREAATEEKQAGGLGELVGLLMKQQEASEARILSVLERLSAKPEGDPLEKALGIIAQVQKINAPTRSSLDGLKEFAEFRALMRDLAGEEHAPKSDGFADLLKAALPVLGEVAKSGADVAKVKAAVALRKAQQAPTAPAPTPGATLPPEVVEQLRQLLQLAPVMPADELAAMVAEQLDDEQAQAVVDAIDGTDWLAQLMALEPGAKAHAKWLEQFAAALLETLTGEPEHHDTPGAATTADDTGAGQPRNAANAEDNGGTGAPGQ